MYIYIYNIKIPREMSKSNLCNVLYKHLFA